MLAWVPDTGSDVDAIGLNQLDQLGGFPENLSVDEDIVTGANGQELRSLGKIDTTLQLDETTHDTTVHVYEELTDALLSRRTLMALGVLPSDWPHVTHVRRLASPPVPSPDVNEVRHLATPAPPLDVDQVRQQLLVEFSDVFDTSSLKPMHGPAMNIELQADAKPSCVHSSRPIPYAFRDQINAQLDEMVANHIIEPVSEPSSWCHPIVIVDKKGTSEKRITVDFKKLNVQVKRPVHPVKTARDVVAGIGSAKYFSKLDARHGYWQVPLTESAKEMTTFITPYGRYRYLRNPQGLISAGDEFNRRTDAAFAGLPNFVKIVDDCLVHDTNLETHLSHVRAVLTRAREHGITLSANKFVFGAESVDFCGYQVSEDGWVVDDAKVSAIADFPIPANRTDLRSFMGLVNQVSEFTPKLAELTAPLRGLLKTSNEFTWTANHTSAFNATKTELVSPPTLAFYQLGLDLRLETDASALKGLGFVLWQRHGEQWRVVQCGSRYLSDAETRYAVIELEMLAVVWALHKCRLYLSGTKFEIVTDHRPLVPVLNSYSLDQIGNPRLLCLRLKVQSFQFHVSWRKGTENVFADALSRNPVDIPTPEEEFGESPALSCRTLRVCLQSQETQSPPVNLRFKVLRDAAAVDEDYQQLVEFVRSGFPPSMRDVPASLRAYWNGREHLSLDSGIVMKGDRIVVPESLRETVLADLHAAHQGLARTKSRACQIVFWPGITAAIEALVRSCPSCRTHQASLAKEPLRNDRQPSLPFEFTSVDFF